VLADERLDRAAMKTQALGERRARRRDPAPGRARGRLEPTNSTTPQPV
jgi:hypothetical protein